MDKTESQASSALQPSNARERHVLYIDDEEPLARLAQRALTRLGFRVSVYLDPIEALEEFRSRPRDFDVVVTDISMPGMSGFDLVREMSAIRPDLPVLMTSGYLREEEEVIALRLGVREIIEKPNTLDHLAQALNRLFTPLTPHPAAH